MSLSRRRFVRTVGAGAAGLWIAGRGREAAAHCGAMQTADEACENGAEKEGAHSSSTETSGACVLARSSVSVDDATPSPQKPKKPIV